MPNPSFTTQCCVEIIDHSDPVLQQISRDYRWPIDERHIWFAYRADVIMGIGAIYKCKHNDYEMHSGLVLSEFRGRGIHAAIIRARVAYAIEKDARLIFARIFPNNTPSLRSCQHAGLDRWGYDGLFEIWGKDVSGIC